MAAFFSTELPWGTTMVAAMPLRGGGERDALAVIAAGGADHALRRCGAPRFSRSM